jgi:hypothetical protein
VHGPIFFALNQSRCLERAREKVPLQMVDTIICESRPLNTAMVKKCT